MLRKTVSALVLIGLVGGSIAGTAAAASADPAILAPTITGSVSLGGTLTADVGDYAGAIKDDPYGYEWINVTENPTTVIARTKTYTPDSGDRGDELTVKVIPVSDPAVTSPGQIITGGTLSTNQNSVLPGASYTVSGAFFAPLIDYVIDAGTSKIPVTSDSAGSFIATVPVLSTEKAGSKSVSAVHLLAGKVSTSTISVTQPPKPPVIKGSSPTISGTVKVGNTVHAAVGSWSSNASFDYQWLRDGKSISGEVNSTYSLKTTDVGHSIRVRVVGATDGASLTVTSSSYKVAAATFASTATVKMKGKAKVGRTLKAVKSGSYRPGDVATKFQWYVNGVKIAGGTKVTLKVKKSWKGKFITVRMTTTKTGYATSTRTAYSAKVKK